MHLGAEFPSSSRPEDVTGQGPRQAFSEFSAFSQIREALGGLPSASVDPICLQLRGILMVARVACLGVACSRPSWTLLRLFLRMHTAKRIAARAVSCPGVSPVLPQGPRGRGRAVSGGHGHSGFFVDQQTVLRFSQPWMRAFCVVQVSSARVFTLPRKSLLQRADRGRL